MDAFLHDMAWVIPLRSDAATTVFQAFTALGYFPFYLLVLPLGYWLWDKVMFTRLALVILTSALINGFLKDLFDDPRPAVEYALDGRVGDSFGLPSGHAQLAVVTWFWFAREFGRAWFWPIAAIIVVGICFSRLYLGVHDVEDVLVGAAIGTLSLGVFTFLLSERMHRWRTLDGRAQLLALLAVQPPLWWLWPEPDGPGEISAVGAFITGWWAGVLIDRRSMDFKRHPSWWRAALAAVLGLYAVFGLAGVLEAPLLAVGLGADLVRWLQTGLMALFITGIAPWLFRVARLGH
ncbi:MAG: phosphatase PAP2 family protein [Pseudomonadales bacterium]|nr:phosphatase PAP2 family protein [Pseudomonadales bacterium]